MSDLFRNPYHFVPLAAGQPPARVPSADIAAPWPGAGSASAHLTHDRYVPGTHSGRITCRATVETPLICGNRQEERKGWTKLIHPFEIIPGQPALPASSLRGMLSALAEAATHSALRVLKAGNARKFFSAVSPDLIPFGSARKLLTLVEQLFGVVEVDDALEKQYHSSTNASFALASRLRVSNGLVSPTLEHSAYQSYLELLTSEQAAAIKGVVQDIPLHNLASPKPPCPPMYFRTAKSGGDYLTKDQLRPGQHHPLGRKFYLRRKNTSQVRSGQVFVHPERLVAKKDLEAMAEQHQSVHQFVRIGTQFEFHLDFDNLSSLELRLLLYILNPTDQFRHQIGHGKPLGLGQMRIEIIGFDLVNRHSRYATDDLNAVRSTNAIDQLSDHMKAFHAWAASNGLNEVLAALELLGSPPNDELPVHYPQASQKRIGKREDARRVDIERGSVEFESAQFEWFVQNDRLKVGHQYLESLIGQTQIPTLRRERGRDRAQNSSHRHVEQEPSEAKDLIGGTHPFRIAKLNRNIDNEKLTFDCVVDKFKHISGSLDGSDRKKLLASSADLKVGDILPLRVRNYINASFQLALPET